MGACSLWYGPLPSGMIQGPRSRDREGLEAVTWCLSRPPVYMPGWKLYFSASSSLSYSLMVDLSPQTRQ